MMKKLLYTFIILVLVGGVSYWYVFHKPHRDLQNEAVAFELKAEKLMSDFSDQPQLADSLYIDQLVSVEGTIKELEERAIFLEPGIYGSLDSTETMPDLKIGMSVKIRGRVLSFDDLFEEVKLDFVRFEDQ